MQTRFNEAAKTSVNKGVHLTHSNLQVVLIYEDYESGWNAMRVYEHILKENCDCLANWNRWRFNDLLLAEAREAAIESLQKADMVIVSAPEDTELSVEAQAALQTGLSLNQKEDRALVSLLGVHGGKKPLSSPLHFYLEDLALRNGYALFSGKYLLPEKDAYTLDSIQLQAETRGPVLNTILNRQMPLHWGINE